MLLLAASLIPACIIPVGPEWQDPPGLPNSAPVIASAFPPQGTRTASPTVVFSVTPKDINIKDVIYVKWITEYPPFATKKNIQTDQIQAPDNGSALRRATMYSPDCFSLDPLISTHQIHFAMSDRPWVDSTSEDAFLKATQGADTVEAHWILERNCQATPR